ncbi:uncharacterized protein KQ657_004444 [Scheffersomyces spartinae]|uniref:Zn(2)-C6 fungal-type domain-containing protein n=1 Tax=Scheffersomyces spartinae TaxID=45513 RepID=A0A9P7VB73_9ASCO|nr:uncharacterized protein KQ657_004444 [Scheffersomyces spartinae]KAG7194764.1 hypothetical protein KQ657_004444 [Scheffersomyces spartinae]
MEMKQENGPLDWSDGGEMVMNLKGRKVRRLACVECRQQKSRCDAYEKAPNACSRCERKNIPCDLNSDYKRTFKRARLAEVERENNELKRSLVMSNHPTYPPTSQQPPSSVSPPISSHQMLGSFNPNQLHPQQHQIQQQGIPPIPVSSIQVPFSAQGPIPINLNHHISLPNTPKNFNNTPQSFTDNNITPKPPQQQLHPSQQFSKTNTSNNNSNGHKTESPLNHFDARFSTASEGSLPNTPSIYRTVAENQLDDFNVNKIQIPESALQCEEKSLDSISLSPEMVRLLFLEFVDFYHPILPVVDVLRGPERIYRLCPALFWVIMLVALRRFEDMSHKALLLELSPIIKDILAEITISPITRYNPTEEDEPIINACSVFSVQAFLLYTFWPPITSSLSADTSWNTIGVALFQAIRIGLHSTSSNSVGNITPQQQDMRIEQAKTWVACNIVSQTIASSFGFPSFVLFDSPVINSCRPGNSIELNRSLRVMMDIANFEDQVGKVLNSNPIDPYGLVDPTERLPLIKLLLRQLDELEIKLSNFHVDGFRKFQLINARIRLLTYYTLDPSRIAEFELKRGLVKLYNACIALITHTQLYQTMNLKFVRYLPGVYILNLWQASCIIGKLINSPLKTIIDLGTGKQCYQTTIGLAAKASILKHDIAYRSSGIMRNMWQLFKTLDEKKLSTLSVSIRSRMSASVFFDCLYLLREQVGMIKLNSRTDDNQDSGENEDEAEEISGDDDEEAVVFEDGDGKGSVTTPSSTSSNKRGRSLSNTVNAESKARKIIRTIPLDPQPISVGMKRSSIFKVVNNPDSSAASALKYSRQDPNQLRATPNTSNLRLEGYTPSKIDGGKSGTSSPKPFAVSAVDSIDISNQPRHTVREGYGVSEGMGNNNNNNKNNKNNYSKPTNRIGVSFSDQSKSATPIPSLSQTPDPLKSIHDNYLSTKMEITGNSINTFSRAQGQSQTRTSEFPSTMFTLESPDQNSLELFDLDTNTDIVWKDIDSVMYDFGFHT